MPLPDLLDQLLPRLEIPGAQGARRFRAGARLPRISTSGWRVARRGAPPAPRSPARAATGARERAHIRARDGRGRDHRARPAIVLGGRLVRRRRHAGRLRDRVTGGLAEPPPGGRLPVRACRRRGVARFGRDPHGRAARVLEVPGAAGGEPPERGLAGGAPEQDRERLRAAADPGDPRPGRSPCADRGRARGRAAGQRRLQARSRPARPGADPGAADRRRRDCERRPARHPTGGSGAVDHRAALRADRPDRAPDRALLAGPRLPRGGAHLRARLTPPQGAARAARGRPARALWTPFQGARAEPEWRLLDRQQPGRRAGPGTAPADAELRRAAG